MDKTKLKTRLLEMTQADYDAARQKFQSLASEARISGGETVERDQQSRAEAAGEMAAAWDEAMHDDEARLNRLAEIDFGPKNAVTDGAAVLVDDRLLVVSVSTQEFDFDGQRAMGISPAAPIYKAMQGLSEGDSFTFNGSDHQIRAIH